MIITDNKDAVHEVLGPSIYTCNGKRQTAFTVKYGNADITYPFDEITQFESEIEEAPNNPYGIWNLKLTFTSGDVIISKDNGGTKCYTVIGKTKNGGDFEIYLSTARKITFKD